MDDGVPVQIEAGGAPFIEHVNERRVADAEKRILKRHVIAHAKLTDLRLGAGKGEGVGGHD